MAKFVFACNFSPGGSDDAPFKTLPTKVLSRYATLVEQHELTGSRKKDQTLVVQSSGELKISSTSRFEPCDTSSGSLLRYCFRQKGIDRGTGQHTHTSIRQVA